MLMLVGGRVGIGLGIRIIIRFCFWIRVSQVFVNNQRPLAMFYVLAFLYPDSFCYLPFQASLFFDENFPSKLDTVWIFLWEGSQLVSKHEGYCSSVLGGLIVIGESLVKTLSCLSYVLSNHSFLLVGKAVASVEN